MNCIFRFWLVAALLPAGCSYLPAQPNVLARYNGHYTYGFEISSFQPCQSSEKWWVADGANQLLEHFRGSNVPQYLDTVYVELTGRVTPAGNYGHLGAYRRELSVENVVFMDVPRKDCVPTPTTTPNR